MKLGYSPPGANTTCTKILLAFLTTIPVRLLIIYTKFPRSQYLSATLINLYILNSLICYFRCCGHNSRNIAYLCKPD